MANANQFTTRLETTESGSVFEVFNVSAPTANTQVSHTLTAGTKTFEIRSRTPSIIQFTHSDGDTGTNYFTIKENCVFTSPQHNFSNMTIYLESSANGNTIEIIEYY